MPALGINATALADSFALSHLADSGTTDSEQTRPLILAQPVGRPSSWKPAAAKPLSNASAIRMRIERIVTKLTSEPPKRFLLPIRRGHHDADRGERPTASMNPTAAP